MILNTSLCLHCFLVLIFISFFSMFFHFFNFTSQLIIIVELAECFSYTYLVFPRFMTPVYSVRFFSLLLSFSFSLSYTFNFYHHLFLLHLFDNFSCLLRKCTNASFTFSLLFLNYNKKNCNIHLFQFTIQPNLKKKL